MERASATPCLAQGCLQRRSWKRRLGESCGAWLLFAVCSYSPQCTAGKVSGTHPYLFPFSICSWTCCPGMYLIPLWSCWRSLLPLPALSAGSTNSYPSAEEYSLSAYPPPGRLCKPQWGLRQPSPPQRRVPASFISPPEADAPSSWPVTCLCQSFPVLH